jgi:hypothetical protein
VSIARWNLKEAFLFIASHLCSTLLVWEPAKGEETSKPKLIHRDKDQPNYGER